MPSRNEILNNSPQTPDASPVDSLTLVFHCETGVGEEDGGTYTRKFSKDDIKNLPVIDDDQINKIMEESGTGAYFYEFEKHQFGGETIVAKTTTEDLGFGHGYETNHDVYLLKKEEKKDIPELSLFVDCDNVFDGLNSEHKDLSADIEKDKAIFDVQDRRVLGEPDPDALHLVQTLADISELQPITVDVLKALKSTTEHQFNFYLYNLQGETIVWMRQIDRESYYEGFDIYNYEYRLEKPVTSEPVSDRVNLQ